MDEGLVSVVLPIYNVEKYLDRCIESVVGQTYKNLEIILVDDGSPDGCPKKCEEWAKRDKRIKVIHKENAGLGYARNTGIDNASGEYICFFDSDDYIATDTIEKTYKIAKENYADVVIFGFSTVDKNGKVGSIVVPEMESLKYVGKEVQTLFLPDLISRNPDNGKTTNLRMSAWTGLYSLKLIQKSGWKFVSERDIISEDVYSLLLLYKHVNCVSIISEAFYYYCENTTSLTHTYRQDRFNRIKHFYNMSVSACDELKYDRSVKERLAEPFIANTIAAMKMVVASNGTSEWKRKEIEKIIKDTTVQDTARTLLQGKQKRTRKLFLNFITKDMYGCCYLLLKISIRK